MSIAEKLSRSLGLESEAPTVEINVDVDEAGAPLDDVDMNGDPTPEADEAELLEAAQEIEDTNDEIDELDEAQATLESIYRAMEDDYQNGGMTPEAVKFATIAVESVGIKYGITGEDVGISLESFQSDRKTASVISMEGVGEFIDNVVKAIIAKVKELMAKLKEFYQKNIAAAGRLKRRATAIKKKARDRSSWNAEDKDIGDDLFQRLNVRGSKPEVAQIVAGIKKTNVTGLDKIVMDESDLDKDLKEVLNADKLTKDGGWDKVVVAKVKAQMAKMPDDGNVASDFDIGGVKTGDNRFNGVTSLPGNVAIGMTVPGTGEISTIDDANKVRGGKYKDSNGVKADKKEKLKTLTINEVETICTAVEDAMSNIIRSKTAKAKDGVKVVKVIEKAGEKIIKDIEGTDESENELKANANRALRAITNSFTASENAGAALVSYNITLSKNALAYASRSLNKYKKD